MVNCIIPPSVSSEWDRTGCSETRAQLSRCLGYDPGTIPKRGTGRKMKALDRVASTRGPEYTFAYKLKDYTVFVFDDSSVVPL